MKHFTLIVILIFLQIIAKSRSATIPKNSDVLWITEELTTPKGFELQQTDTPLQVKGKELLRIIDEMRDFIENMHADESNSYNAPCGDGTREEAKARAVNYYKLRIREFTNPGPVPFGSTIQEQQLETLDSVIRKYEERRRTYTYQPSIKSIHPICNETEILIVKEDKFSQNISFSFSIDPLKPANMDIDVISATMNIYKMGYKDPTNSTPALNVNFTLSYFKGSLTSKNNTVKKGRKHGPPQVLRADEERWLQWNVTKIALEWLNTTTPRKHWITIKVAADQEPLPAFFAINCSKITALTDGIRNGMTIDKEIPYLNITIKEIPKRDNEFNNKEQKLINGVNELRQSISKASDLSNSAERKTRHGKKNKDSEIATENTLDRSDDST